MNNLSKIFSSIAIVCSLFFIINRLVMITPYIQSDGLLIHISVLLSIISICFLVWGNILTLLNHKLYNRTKLYFVSFALFAFVIILSNINYGTSLNNPPYIRILLGMFTMVLIYHFFDLKKTSLAYFFIGAFLFISLLMIGKEIQVSFQSNLGYSIGMIGTFLFTALSSWIEVYERMADN